MIIIIQCINRKEAFLFLSSIYFNSVKENKIIVSYGKISCKIYFLTNWGNHVKTGYGI